MIDLDKPPCYVLQFTVSHECDPLFPDGEYLVQEFFCCGYPRVSATPKLSWATRFTYEAANVIKEFGIEGSDDQLVYPDEVEIVCVPEYVGHWLAITGETSQ